MKEKTNYGKKIFWIAQPLIVHTVISILAAFCIGWGKDLWALLQGRPALQVPLDGTDAALVTVATAVVCLVVFWKFWKPEMKFFLERMKQKKNWKFYAAVFLTGSAASCFFSFLMDWMGMNQYFSNQVQEELFSAGILLQMIGLGVIIPILEEVLYRGLIYGRLFAVMDRKAAAVTAALIFALAHGNMIQFFYALPMAGILHWLYEKEGSLRAPILFHMGANLISVAVNLFLGV